MDSLAGRQKIQDQILHFTLENLVGRKEATYGDIKDINKVLKKAQLEKDVTLEFSKLGHIDQLKIIAYTDSSYRNSEHKEKSVGGRFICIANNAGMDVHHWLGKAKLFSRCAKV